MLLLWSWQTHRQTCKRSRCSTTPMQSHCLMNFAAFAHVFVYCDIGASPAGSRCCVSTAPSNISRALAAFRCVCNYKASSASTAAGAVPYSYFCFCESFSACCNSVTRAPVQAARQSVMRVEALLQSQDVHQLSLVHASLFQAQLSGDDHACLPVSSASRARDCAAALLPSPLTSLSHCPVAQIVSGARSEVSCARASCNMFGSSDGAGVADDFVHQWCAGRATLQFGRNVFYAGASVCCFVTCVALLIIIP
jgi:hypothetical protein